MLSAEALAALGGLEHGARYNAVHTTARELIGAGLARDDWGYLGLTEAGRIYLRRGRFTVRIDSDDVSDLSSHAAGISVPINRRPQPFWVNAAELDDPMIAPHRAAAAAAAVAAPLELLPEAPAEPLPIAETRRQEMLRAAGVASGKTGVWMDEKWVEEFIRALDADAP